MIKFTKLYHDVLSALTAVKQKVQPPVFQNLENDGPNKGRAPGEYFSPDPEPLQTALIGEKRWFDPETRTLYDELGGKAWSGIDWDGSSAVIVVERINGYPELCWRPV
jgi:hypothetical protein